jgi:hypothetical protein
MLVFIKATLNRLLYNKELKVEFDQLYYVLPVGKF